MNVGLMTGLGLTLALSPVAAAPPPTPDPFPEIPGWTLTVDTTVYTSKNLWDFIDGAAEMFLSYHFVDLTLGTYAAAGLEVRVEAYRHASPTDAFGIYAAERKQDYIFIEMGTQGYEEEGVLNFLSDDYYVKLSTHEQGDRATAALRAVARGVAAHLDGVRRWPPELRLLPDQGRMPNSEGYVSQNFLGYTFLGNAFTALYEHELLLFVIDFRTPEDVAAAVERYRTVVPEVTLHRGGIRLADPNNGPVTLVVKGTLLYGLVNPPSESVEDRYVTLIQGP